MVGRCRRKRYGKVVFVVGGVNRMARHRTSVNVTPTTVPMAQAEPRTKCAVPSTTVALPVPM